MLHNYSLIGVLSALHFNLKKLFGKFGYVPVCYFLHSVIPDFNRRKLKKKETKNPK